MNRILAIMALSLLLTAGNTYAHCGKCGVGDAPKAAGTDAKMDMGAMVAEKTEKLTKELNLTDDQKTKVQAILQEKMTKKQAIMDEKHKAMDALHEEFKTKLGAILTPEQMKTWEEMKKDGHGMKGMCPMCKDGKMCEMCMKKGKKGGEHEHSHDDHGHDAKP